MLAVRAFILMFSSAFLLFAVWVAYSFIADGLSAQMMGFEREPVQGVAYWRCYYLKRSIWGILGTVGVLVVFAALVIYGWVVFMRDVKQR